MILSRVPHAAQGEASRAVTPRFGLRALMRFTLHRIRDT
jgi:hypothetical protein